MRLFQAALYGFLTTAYGGSIYFLFGLVFALAQGTDSSKFLGDFLIAVLVCFIGSTFFFYEMIGAFERLNKPRSKDDEPRGSSGDPDSDPNENHN